MSAVKKMMFNKKRKRKQPSDENLDKPQEIKKKRDDFTEIEFKLMLRDSNKIFEGLKKFIEAAQRDPEEDYDLVLKYCQSSNDCSEIFSLMEAEKRKQSETAVIFNTLECILIRIAGSVDKLKTVGQLIVQRLVTSHLSLICFCLGMNNKSTQIKAALKLLCAMVMIGGNSCRAVMSQFNFRHQNIAPLFNRRDRKDEQDVRTCIVHFVMSFLLAGDNGVIRKLVEQKTMLQGVLRGLPEDKLSTIQLIIPTVLEKVIQNPSVSKTSKIQLFSENVLKMLSTMYDWQGPGSWKDKKNKKSAVLLKNEDKCSDEHSQLVAQMIHVLFLELCCSFRNGLCFFDKTFGTSGKNQNQLLTKLFTSLTKSVENLLCKELITKFLITCPDQLQYVLSSLESSLTPRPSVKWISCMDFILEIYTAQPPLPPVLSHWESNTSDKLAAMVSVFFVPPEKVLHVLSHTLKHKSAIVWYKMLQLLKLILQRAVGVLLHCSSNLSKASSPADQNYWTSVIELVRQNLIKCLPDDSDLFACWKQMSSRENEEKGLDPELSPTDHLDQLILLEQVSCLYQELYPSLLIENHQFLTLLLDSTRELGGDNSGEGEVKSVLPQLYLLKLLAGTDARKLPWSKTLKDGHTLMYSLLDMMQLVQHNDRLVQMTQTLICKLLASTNLFEGTEKELDIWFHHFAVHLAQNESSVILKFMAQILSTFVSNPFPYIEKVTELLADSTSQLDLSGAGDTRSIGTAESVIDGILEMDEDDFMLLDSSNSVELTHSAASPSLPFSPVVLISLETLESHEEFKTSVALQGLLCSVLLDIFHTQLDPSPLSVLLEQHLSVFEKSREILYITSWSPKKKTCSWKPSKDLKQVTSVSKLLMCLQAGSFVVDDRFQDRLTTAVSTLSVKDSVNTVQQILLLIRKTIDRFEQIPEKGPVLLSVLFKLIKDIKESLLKLTEDTKVCSQPSVMSEFDMLDVKETTTEEALVDIAKTVLDHPYIEKWFLFTRNILDGTKMKPDSEKLLTRLVTQQLVQMLDGLPSVLSAGFKKNLQSYCNKINNTLESIVEGKSTMCEFSIILKSMVVFVKYTDFEDHTGFLNNLLNFPISQLIDHGKVKKLSNAGKLVIQLASATLSDQGHLRSQGKELSLAKMATIFDLLTVSSDGFLEKYCCQALEAEKSYAVVVSEDLFYALFTELSELRISIIQHVVGYSVACRVWFEKWITENEGLLKKNKLLLVKPVQAYLIALKQKDKDYELHTRACLDVLKRVYMKKKINIVSEHSSILTVIHLLIQVKAVDDAEMMEYWKVLSHSTESKSCLLLEHVDIIMHLHRTLGQSLASCNREHTLLLLMKILMNASAKKEDRNEKFEDYVLTLIEQFLQSNVLSLGNDLKVIWKNFVKASLKSLYLNPKLLRILSQLLPLVYTESCDISLPIASLHQMVMSHSQFLPVMFDEKEEEIKESLVSLLADLLERNPECSSLSHCGLLLGSYNASLSVTDQTILKLIYLYEQQGSWIKDQRPFLWGPKAIEHYSARKNLGLSLWKHPSMTQTLDNLDVQMMYRSILHFPLRRNIVPDQVSGARELQSKPDVYDPCFLLPLFSILLSPDSVVDCRKFVELQCLGYALAAVSSHVSDVRRAAYHLLGAFVYHLEASRMQERVQVANVLDVLRNSCQDANVKLACIVSQFLAKAVRQQLDIGDHMYRIINTFLTLKPDMDISNVPEFYKLFRSSVLEFREDRSWVLALLVDGLRDTADYRVMERRYTVKLLLTFHDSALSDAQCQVQVLKIVKAACSVRTVASDLVKTQGLVTWLNAAILSMRAEKVTLIADVLHTLWFTLMSQWKSPTTEHTGSPDNHKHVLPLKLSREILLCVKGFMQNCGSCSMTAWLRVLEVMVSAVHNINTVMSRLHAQGHLINVETLNLKDVCFILLHSGRLLHQDVFVTYTTNILRDLGFETNLVVQEPAKFGIRHVPETGSSLSHSEVTEGGKNDQKQNGKSSKKTDEEGDQKSDVEDEKKPDKENGEKPNGENDEKLNSKEDKKKQLDQEAVDQADKQKDRATENQLIKKTVEACLFWNPTERTSSDLQEITVTGILVTLSWFLRSISLKDRHVLSMSLEWMKKHLSDDNHISKASIERLVCGSEFTVGVLNGLLEVYTFIFSGKEDVTVDNNNSHCLDMLNSIVLTLFKSASAKTSCWSEMADYLNKWKGDTAMITQELLSLPLREFLMESRLAAQPNPVLRWSAFIRDQQASGPEKNCRSNKTKSESVSQYPGNDISSSEYDSDDEMTSSDKSESGNVHKHLTKLKQKVGVKRKLSTVAQKKKLKGLDFIKIQKSQKMSKRSVKVSQKEKNLKRFR